MSAIWKFSLPTAPMSYYLEIPKGAQLLSVRVQFGRPYVWAVVDPEAESESRKVISVMTGSSTGQLGPYIGSALLDAGGFVLHYFEDLS